MKSLILVLVVLDYFLCFLKITEHKTTTTPSSYASFVVINMIYAYIVVLLLPVILFEVGQHGDIAKYNLFRSYLLLSILLDISWQSMYGGFFLNPHTVLLNNLLSCAYAVIPIPEQEKTHHLRNFLI